MKDFKELQKLIDDYYKCWDENGNEVNDQWLDLQDLIQQQLEYLINWEDKLKDIKDEIDTLRKAIKTHTHKKGMVYVKY